MSSVHPTHDETISISPVERIVRIANYKTLSVSAFASAHLEKGDGYIVVNGQKVLLKAHQIEALRAEHSAEIRKQSALKAAVEPLNLFREKSEDMLRSELPQNYAKLVERNPTVVCLCGSTKFWREFQRASLRETMAGRIVLSIGAATGTDDEHFGKLDPGEYEAIKEMLDTLHLRKIRMSDEILVLNVNDYIGSSTRRELWFARDCGIPVRWLEKSAHSLHSERIG